MKPRLLVVAGLALALASCAAWRSRTGGEDAWTLWQEVRRAHGGGQALSRMSFHAEEEFLPGVGGLLYPELGDRWRTRSGFDFRRGHAWQSAWRRGQTLTWELGPNGFTSVRSGGVALPGGVGGAFHLRALLWLLRPWDAALDDEVELVRLPRRQERERLQLRYHAGMRDTFVLEIDPRSRLVQAVEYTVNALRVPTRCRLELHDLRDVGGVVLPHELVELLVLPGGDVPFHRMRLWDIEAR